MPRTSNETSRRALCVKDVVVAREGSVDGFEDKCFSRLASTFCACLCAAAVMADTLAVCWQSHLPSIAMSLSTSGRMCFVCRIRQEQDVFANVGTVNKCCRTYAAPHVSPAATAVTTAY